MPTYDNLPDTDYEFELLTIEQRRAMLDERKGRYEAMLYDNLMNQKVEALSTNPQRNRAIRALGEEASHLKNCIEMVNFEISMLEQAEVAEKEDEEALEPEKVLSSLPPLDEQAAGN